MAFDEPLKNAEDVAINLVRDAKKTKGEFFLVTKEDLRARSGRKRIREAFVSDVNDWLYDLDWNLMTVDDYDNFVLFTLPRWREFSRLPNN